MNKLFPSATEALKGVDYLLMESVYGDRNHTERAVRRERLEATIEDNFKRSLMQFYGNALLEYDNQSIRVLPAKAEGAEAPKKKAKDDESKPARKTSAVAPSRPGAIQA